MALILNVPAAHFACAARHARPLCRQIGLDVDTHVLGSRDEVWPLDPSQLWKRRPEHAAQVHLAIHLRDVGCFDVALGGC